MDKQIEDKIYKFLKELHTEIDVVYHVDIDEIDMDNPYQSIYNMIEDGDGFDIEIIYYQNAIEYLMENDNSLRESLGIAADFGYECKNLNSEILASLLASQNSREEFSQLESEIENFFEEIKKEIEASEEEEDEEEEDEEETD